MTPEKLDSLAASFTRALKAGGKADRTRKLYAETVGFFSAWCDGQGIPADLSALTKANVVDWLGNLRDRKLADSTIAYRWRALHRFARWLVDEEILDTDPLSGITVDRPEPPHVAVLTDDELAALIRACRGNGFRERRDEAMIRLLIDCGLRVAELVGIDVEDLDLDGETVTVTGKGGRRRSAYFGGRTGLALDRYLRARRTHRFSSDPALFLGERGRFTPDGVRERMKNPGPAGRSGPDEGAPARFPAFLGARLAAQRWGF